MIDPKNKLAVLIVDDEFVFRELNKKFITAYLTEKIKHNIFTANCPEDALEIVKQNNIDIVFSDLLMNGTIDCGFNLASQIKKLNPKTQVFIVSNAAPNSLNEKENAIPVNGCFQMPLKQVDLESVFYDLL